MLDKSSRSKSFAGLNAEDKDLTMFTITNLTLVLEKEDNLVYMGIKLKRKVVTELVTTYLPTILLLLITYTTTGSPTFVLATPKRCKKSSVRQERAPTRH